MAGRWVYGLNKTTLRDVAAARTVEDLAAVTISCLTTMGFRHMTYHLVKIAGYGDFLPTLFSSFPEDWTNRYLTRGYAKADPVLRAARMTCLAFDWRDLTARTLSEGDRRYLGEASAHGVSDGYTVPVHFPKGFAVFSVHPDGAERDRFDLLALAGPAVMSLAFHVHDRACSLMEQRVLVERAIDSGLSERERECITWLCAGHSATEIADILTIAPATVTHHLRRAASRLNAANRIQLCVRAVTLGLVEPG